MKLIPADKVKELLHGGWSLDTDADVEYVCSLVDEIPAIILEEDVISKQEFTDSVIRTAFNQKAWDPECAVKDMMHMIGMYPEGRRRPYKRHGKVYYRPYRNYWDGCNRYLEYFSSIGLTEKTTPVFNGGMPVYRISKNGMKWLGWKLGMKIYFEDE